MFERNCTPMKSTGSEEEFKFNGGFLEGVIQTRKVGMEDSLTVPLDEDKKCQSCKMPQIDGEILKAFSIPMCKKCSISQIRLIPKTKCKEYFLLSDSDLKHFGSIERSNPHKAEWSSMQLYNRAAIEEFSLARYGTMENIEKERSRREMRKKARKIESVKKRVKSMRKHVFLRKEGPPHEHKFIQNGENGECECGMIVKQEEI